MRHVRALGEVRVLLIVFATLAALPALPAAGATEYDGKYTGQIACDILPGQTTKPLRTDFLLKIVDGRALYEREVLQADSTQPQGVTEHGTGVVSAGGELTVTGSAVAKGWRYEATYRGQFAGKTVRLSGTQQWRLSTGPYARPCTITLSKSE